MLGHLECGHDHCLGAVISDILVMLVMVSAGDNILLIQISDVGLLNSGKHG